MIHDWTQLFGVIAFFVVVLAVPGILILILARLAGPSRDIELPSIVDKTEIVKDEHKESHTTPNPE